MSPARKRSVDQVNIEDDAEVDGCVEEATRTSLKPRSSAFPVLHDQPADCAAREVRHGRRDAQRETSEEEGGKNVTAEEEPRRAYARLSGSSDCDDDDDDDDDGDHYEDVVTLVLSDDRVPCVTDDEFHYITTHEIQLSELSDHEGDNDAGVGSSAWDVENDSQAYSFVHYAPCDGASRERGERGKGEQAAGGTRDAAERATSPDGGRPSKTQRSHGNASGQIHVSIKTTSRAINEPGGVRDQGNIICHARRSGDVSRYVLRGADGRAEALRDAKCLIATPGRLHFGGRLKGKELAEYSSGTSSGVSELDDADKEVRNLTARAFKSLAYPYFDAINFSTSSESSASEHRLGMNTWSAIVGLQYGKVNMSQEVDPTALSRTDPASSEVAGKTDCKVHEVVALASTKPPTSKIFALRGNPHDASANRIELMGEFGQGRSGVITLTETLNFRCNMSGEKTHSQSAPNAPGSRPPDKVTHTLPAGQRRGAQNPACSAAEGMEDTHKKAIFASSIIKNVISKKMQFEQERKMERGEISEPRHSPSPCVERGRRERDPSREPRALHSQSPKVSDTGSEYALVCVDELGDMVDSESGRSRSDGQRPDSSTLAPEANLESTNEAGIHTKKGASEAAKSSLLQSQNSAFRCWRDAEVEFRRGRKDDISTPEGTVAACRHDLEEKDPDNGTLTKMSHLFVPSIQRLPSDGGPGDHLPTVNYSTGTAVEDGERGGGRMRVGSGTLRLAGSRPVATSRSPEIKISLRSVRDSRTEAPATSKPQPPGHGCGTGQPPRPEDLRCQVLAAALKGESSDKVPHFMVRDIRDNKGKLQTPIHQVRDVRKLVKSSYHFVSVDGDSKSCLASADPHAEQKKQAPFRNPAPAGPMVIKCQSVNTNSTERQAGIPGDVPKPGAKEDPQELDRASPGLKACPAPVKRPAERKSTKEESSRSEAGLRSEAKTAPWKQEKTADLADKTQESKMSHQVALEKLQAAVKTMEQLYTFDKNEWKRKGKPSPLTGSHVLSLITTEEHGGPEEEPGKMASTRTTSPGTDVSRKEKRAAAKASLTRDTDGCEERLGTKSLSDQSSGAPESRSLFNQSLSSNTASENKARTPQPTSATQAPHSGRGFIPSSAKVSSKSSQTKQTVESQQKLAGEAERYGQNPPSVSADSENYLTIPLKSLTSHSKPASSSSSAGPDKTSASGFGDPVAMPGPAGPSAHGDLRPSGGTKVQQKPRQSPQRSSIVLDARSPDMPAAAMFHPLPLTVASGQQVYCFSPTVTPAPTLEAFQATQRKMLLDPTTGNYYLVDTPFQPATKRLFDPETGQCVDVPIPQSPMTPVPISPLALSQGAYGHTYMIYPGFIPSPPVIATRFLAQSQMSMQSDASSGDKLCPQHPEGMYMESPYYMATGRCPQVGFAVQQNTATDRASQASSDPRKPVVSLSAQQGPRIIAPPSFGGTTMSFVVEHG